MLHRSSSSRRRRASRSSASSPQARAPRSAGTSPGRRASIAVSPVDVDRQRSMLVPEISRSPRHSIIPDISFDSREGSSPDEPSPPLCSRSPRHSIAPESLSPRGSLIPDSALSPRNSLIPDSSRSPRHSFSLSPGDYSRSPRNSLVPDRNSLVPDTFNRSPRNSLVPDSAPKSPRNNLAPDFNRSPRHSLVPDSNTHGSRLSLAPDFNRSPRNSLVPDSNRSPRGSLVPSESTTWNQPSPEELMNRSPRHSIIPDPNRSPRGSIAPDRTSPRGSIAEEYISDRSPRGSIGPEINQCRSHRGSLVKNMLLPEENGRSPRGSLTLTFHDPPASEVRRYSADSNGYRGRSTSPYKSASTKGAVNMGYNSNSVLSEGGSRRPSSSVSQVSADEQRRLCSEHKKYIDGEQGLGMSISLTTYGSVAYQLKDANLEASGTCDFVCKAMSIVNKTVVVTIVLVVLSTLPLLMLIMGIQYLRDCPREPHIPIYMVVGGTVGCIKMAWLLWSQLHTHTPPEMGSMNNATSIGARVGSLALTIFLIAWFSLGNYWILRIKWPEYQPTLFEPNRWCHRTLYVFALVHLYIMYSVLGAILVLVVTLAGSQLFGCPWLGSTRYK